MMERLRIEYGTGYMELIVEAFFPCKMPDGYTALCGMYKKIEEALPADTPERRHWRAQFNKTEVLHKRMEGNIRLISGGRKE